MGQFLPHTYFNSYYYANALSNIISREDADVLGFLSHFFDDADAALWLTEPYRKHSAFHKFIQHIVFEFFENDMSGYDESVHRHHTIDKKPLDDLYAEIAFANFGMDYDFVSFNGQRDRVDFEMIEAYHDDLRLTGYLEELYDKIANEVFQLLFMNRNVLLQFNQIASEYVHYIEKDEIEEQKYKDYFKTDGTLKRVSIPKWCQKAVFFRDRGRCCFCGRDLSGLFSTESVKHFDHIVPLALGGLNDVANLQLLCSKCNLSKSGSIVRTSSQYEFWF